MIRQVTQLKKVDEKETNSNDLEMYLSFNFIETDSIMSMVCSCKTSLLLSMSYQ